MHVATLLAVFGCLLSVQASLALEPHFKIDRRAVHHRRLSNKRRAFSGIKLSGIPFGLVPDEGDAGGPATKMSQLNAAVGGNFSTYGYYAQAQAGVPFDGHQLLGVFSDVVASGAIFEAAVMPTGGFVGYNSKDNSQSVNICKVMKKFTDAGVRTRLRFAHECNYYITDGTYKGSLSDCKAAFTNVAQTCRSIAPSVQMFLTPNVDGNGLNAYKAMFPDDASLVDVCGIDYYPKSAPSSSEFRSIHQQFYNYCLSRNSKIVYAIAETGLGYAGSDSARLSWLKQMYSSTTRKAMPKLVSLTWFNYQKGYDFRVVAASKTSSITKAFLKLPGLTKS